MSSLELRNVSKRFGEFQAIKNLNLKVEDGSFCALLGPSGCGKSTLLRMIAGLEEVDEGEILIDGIDVTRRHPAERGTAMVFQSYALYPHLTVAENIGFPLSVAGEGKAAIAQRVQEVARQLKLEEVLARKPSQLSGGQRQRVAIGRALVRQPKIFLFDEPLSNLDALLRVQMRLELARLHRQVPTTKIYVTHDQVEAMTLADRIVVMNKGEIAQVGTPLELYEKPADRFVGSFVGSPAMNFMPCTPEPGQEGRVRLSNGRIVELAAARFGSQCLGARPEHMFLCPADEGARIAKGRINLVERLGAQAFAIVDSDLGELTIQMDPSSDLKLDQEVGIGLIAKKCHCF